MKKLLVVFFSMCLLFSFVGCTKAEKTSEPQKPVVVSNVKEAPKTESATLTTDWTPTKTINWVVPYEAGGNSDVMARVMAKYMSKYSAKSIEITNIIGAGGRAGAEEVKKAAPDGHTILLQPVAYPMQYSLGIAKFTYEDFSPITLWADSSLAIVVNTKSGISNMDQLAAEAKANPGKLKMGSKTGTLPLFAILDLQKRLNVQFNLVDLDNKAPELLSRRIDCYIDGIGAVKQYIDSGDFTCIGIISDVDVPALENLMTYKELGYTDFEFLKQSFGMWAPLNTPPAAVDYINKLVQQAASDPACIAEMKNLGVSPTHMSVADYTTYMASTYESFKAIAAMII